MRFLASLLLSGAGSACARHFDTVIVGAGLSGLGAAKTLSEAGQSFIVLEARNRTGGRIYDIKLRNGGYSEMGAEFVGPTQDKVLDLVTELGLTLTKVYTSGTNILWYDGQPLRYQSNGETGVVPPIDDLGLEQVFTVVKEVNSMASQIDVQNPWDGPVEWDQQTFADWLDARTLSEKARFLIDIAVQSIWSVLPSELSLLYVAAYIAAGGNATIPGTLERLISTADGAETYRVDGGAQLLATRLAEKVGNVQLNAPVSKITLDGSKYTVTLANGSTVDGAHVIVAMAPPPAGRIVYEPPVPRARETLTNEMRMGAIGKATAVYYSGPWWRDEGLTAQVLSDSGLSSITFDQSRHGDAGGYGAIMSLLGADDIRAFDNATETEMIKQLSYDFATYFGSKSADVDEWAVYRWDNDEYSRGGPVAVAGPGVYSQVGSALRRKVGNLHFAGTESSDYWVGYMDGALRSGYRAASEVLESERLLVQGRQGQA